MKIKASGKKGPKCPNCGSTNTTAHDDNWRAHCWDCGHSWEPKKGKRK